MKSLMNPNLMIYQKTIIDNLTYKEIILYNYERANKGLKSRSIDKLCHTMIKL